MTTLQIQCTHIQYMYLHGSNNRRVTSRYTRRFSCFVVRLTSSSTMRWNGWGYDDTKLFLSRRYCAHHSHCAFDRHRRLERYCWKLSGYGIVEGRSTEIEHRPINLHQAGDGLLPEINGDPPSERLAICSDIRIWRLIFEAHP